MIEIKLPKASSEMTDGEISAWIAEDGATVVEGQPIYVLATDKAEMEIEAPVGGILTHVGQVGENYEVGTVLARIQEPND